MSRHRIPGVPQGVVVLVGWDQALGYWCEARRPGEPQVVYDATTTEDGCTSITKMLETLIGAGVIVREDVADAEMWLAEDDVEDTPEEHVGLRVAAQELVVFELARSCTWVEKAHCFNAYNTSKGASEIFCAPTRTSCAIGQESLVAENKHYDNISSCALAH